MAGGSWAQTFTQVIHQSVAMAGLLFLGVALHRFAMTRYASRSTPVSLHRLQLCSLGGFVRGNPPYVTDEQNMHRNSASA
jgi:hypothetical protein